VSAVASAIANGTLRMRASVCASSVLPQPSAEQQDVRLLKLDVAVLLAHLHALVVVVDRDRERALRLLLRDDVVVEDAVDVLRPRQVVEVELCGSRELLVDDLVAEIDALVADVDARAGDELLDLTLALAAEAAEKLFVALARTRPSSPFTPEIAAALGRAAAFVESRLVTTHR
jgi:hypothetical protein